MRSLLFTFLIVTVGSSLLATEYHVAKDGKDSNTGTAIAPFATISEAVKHAYPGDIITVHEGVYREWVNPIRGGESDTRRIVYRAAPGEQVAIKGSEEITGWKRVKANVWKVEIPHTFFGQYNPFVDSVYGDWFHRLGRVHHTGDVFLNGNSLYEVESLDKVYQPRVDPQKANVDGQKYTWHCENEDGTTTIYANFHDYDPNKELTEVSARKTCFYPSQPGINYITIRGFDISQAATQWAAPTAEQVGMVATHWNKGWIIEDNLIHDSRCNGITLGKERGTGHNVWLADAENINRDGNIQYIEVIFRVLRNNWNKEHVGSHIVRNNAIYNCEQTGICGSMGVVFSTIENNHIYNINVKAQFKGWEIGGIKFHAPIDVLIKGNRIHDCERGIWLDWMTQGTRVSGNVLYRNIDQDLFMEVNHGPYLVDNNIFLSRKPLKNQSQGGAYVHNLFMGVIETVNDMSRFTPYFEPHSIDMAGMSAIAGGDNQFVNNIIGAATLSENEGHNWMLQYDSTRYPNRFQGNVYLNGVAAPEVEQSEKSYHDSYVPFGLVESEDELVLEMDLSFLSTMEKGALFSADMLEPTKLSKAPFDSPDATPIVFDADMMGRLRLPDAVIAGPFYGGVRKLGSATVWKR